MDIKNNTKIISAIIVVIIIILSSTLVYLSLDLDEVKKDTKKEEEIIIDNRISPYTNQGLVLEVLRIRHRGLLDKILNFGTSWKNKPQFYFISNIDNTEYISKNVAAAGAESEILFNTWDTFFQENKIMEDTPEGQETSTVKLSILERESSGLLGLKTEDILKEEIEVNYDYRTGRWGGDDNFMDSDGYGHYVGETFEVWFNIYQTGADSDSIPFWTEVNILKTDPRVDDSKQDPDNDGIPTSWEWKWGYDPNNCDDHMNLDPDVDGIQNIEEYQMSKWLSNPYKRDIYLEVDGMERGGLFDPPHVFHEESEQILIERFAQNGINLYIDNGWPDSPKNGGGQLVPHVETISQDSGMILQFYRHYFPEERKGTFRYMLVGHNTGFCHPSVSNKYDTIAIDSSLNKLFRRKAFTPRTQRIVLATAALHELGHSQGLGSWTFAGIDNRTIYDRSKKDEFLEKWSSYESVMNYHYIFNKKLVDYSHGENGAPYDQDDWSVLYLPTFEMDAEVIEGPNYADMVDFGEKKSAIVAKEKNLSDEDWEYSEELTSKFIDLTNSEENIYNGDYEMLILIKSDESDVQTKRDARIYIKPKVEPVFSTWSLYKEGKLNKEDNTIEFYSLEDELNKIYEYNQTNE